ncbi:methionine ABC transporter ATP-binding protein [Williamsia sp. 1138]|uniref:methionine ABC transporter ATP-binding protein n=1 Tax=Williamsia sp. 1138 TaxID=1903117 RepID=UPI000A0F67D2|nr:ATP-binding cassette domain-containing protein [Williamsia sp. 1138]OZG26629.1 methionine ABC transporter ATP-binding protein [Williamsia sp. 1138]
MIEVEKLGKIYGSGPAATTVLDDVSFTVDPGEIFAIVGPSGAGKSTLAHCLNLLERPTSGKVVVNNQNLTELGSSALRDARRRIGTVFQSSSLLSRRTAAENVALPLEFLGVTKVQTRSRVNELLDRVGLTDRATLYPHQLSGGQRQRVGIARALALRPSVLLSDEATSGLDPQTTDSFLELLREVRQELDLAVVFITHEMDTIVKVADSVGRLDSGRIVEKGLLVDLLTDSTSVLGRSLRPRGTSADPGPGQRSVELTYNSASVPADWITRISAELATPVAVLGAAVQVVEGVSIGSVTVSIPDEVAAAFIDSAARHGLAGSVTTPSQVEVAA